MAKGLFLHDSIIDTILFASKGDRAKMGEVFEALVDYARTGSVRPDISDLTKMVLINAVPLIDISNARALAGAKGGARSHGGGAPKGNRNASKQQANNKQNNKQTKQLKTTKQQAKQQANTNVPPCNFMVNNELQAKQQANNKQTTSDIDIDIDIDRLNTSPLTELVLSQEKINKKEKSETAPATLEGGAAPSFSEARNDFSRDYNARVSATIERGVSAMPQPPSDISKTQQSPHTPSPRSPEYNCAERFLRGIDGHDVTYDDSKAAEIERDRALFEQYKTMAVEGETPEARKLFKELAKETKTKIANYERAKKQTDGNETASVRP